MRGTIAVSRGGITSRAVMRKTWSLNEPAGPLVVKLESPGVALSQSR